MWMFANTFCSFPRLSPGHVKERVHISASLPAFVNFSEARASARQSEPVYILVHPAIHRDVWQAAELVSFCLAALLWT